MITKALRFLRACHKQLPVANSTLLPLHRAQQTLYYTFTGHTHSTTKCRQKRKARSSLQSYSRGFYSPGLFLWSNHQRLLIKSKTNPRGEGDSRNNTKNLTTVTPTPLKLQINICNYKTILNPQGYMVHVTRHQQAHSHNPSCAEFPN